MKTKEKLKEIFEKAVKIAEIKKGYSKYNAQVITIDENGEMEVDFYEPSSCSCCPGDEYSYTLDLKDLDKSSDELTKEAEEVKRVKEEAQIKKAEEEKKRKAADKKRLANEKEEQEYKQFLILKNKYEN